MKEANKKDIVKILCDTNMEHTNTLFQMAYAEKNNSLGNNVYLRGIIEFSNICSKDCYYCGIRKSNNNFSRYIMKETEIIESALWAYKRGLGSIVLQSGERTDKTFVNFVEKIILRINTITQGKLRITISCGEQSKDTYHRWFNAGAHRYLLRIESSNPKLYSKLHPSSHNFKQRVDCLLYLKEIGYQVGTGIMIGLPDQKFEDLANDILFFKSMDIDMLGMGPFLNHQHTKYKNFKSLIANEKLALYKLSLKMIALSRLIMPKINIAATTALQALFPFGREKALMCGANIFMPNISQKEYRDKYLLYESKPCVDDDSDQCLNCVEARINGLGESIKYFQAGDSLAYHERIVTKVQ